MMNALEQLSRCRLSICHCWELAGVLDCFPRLLCRNHPAWLQPVINQDQHQQEPRCRIHLCPVLTSIRPLLTSSFVQCFWLQEWIPLHLTRIGFLQIQSKGTLLALSYSCLDWIAIGSWLLLCYITATVHALPLLSSMSLLLWLFSHSCRSTTYTQGSVLGTVLGPCDTISDCVCHPFCQPYNKTTQLRQSGEYCLPRWYCFLSCLCRLSCLLQ